MNSTPVPNPHDPSHRSQSRVRLLVGAGVLALALGGALVACSNDKSADSDRTETTGTVAAASSDGTVADVPAGDSSSGGNASSGAPSGGGQSGGQSGNQSGGSSGDTPSNPQPTAAAPVITSFTTPEDIDCHNGNLQNFTAEWTTTNAVKVTISIDGPGIYDTYPANGDASLPFNCSSPHSFLLTAHGQDGQTATKSVTLQPRNVQP